MSRKYNIRNLDDLHAEVSRLKAEYRFKEEVLIDDSKKYVRQFTPGNLIKRFATPSAFLKADDKYNISSTVLSWALPIFMNRTLFKGCVDLFFPGEKNGLTFQQGNSTMCELEFKSLSLCQS